MTCISFLSMSSEANPKSSTGPKDIVKLILVFFRKNSNRYLTRYSVIRRIRDFQLNLCLYSVEYRKILFRWSLTRAYLYNEFRTLRYSWLFEGHRQSPHLCKNHLDSIKVDFKNKFRSTQSEGNCKLESANIGLFFSYWKTLRFKKRSLKEIVALVL